VVILSVAKDLVASARVIPSPSTMLGVNSARDPGACEDRLRFAPRIAVGFVIPNPREARAKDLIGSAGPLEERWS